MHSTKLGDLTVSAQGLITLSSADLGRLDPLADEVTGARY